METWHCCACRADHPVEDTPIGKVIVCKSAPPETFVLMNTKYFTPPYCTCGRGLQSLN